MVVGTVELVEPGTEISAETLRIGGQTVRLTSTARARIGSPLASQATAAMEIVSARKPIA